jgi:hypothetical protein
MENAPAPFICPLTFALKDAKGILQSEGPAKATLDGGAFTLTTEAGATLRIVDRDVDAVREEGRNVIARLEAGGELALSKAGREHEALVRRLTEFCDRGLIRDLLMEEAEIFTPLEARASFKEQFGVRGSEFGGGQGLPNSQLPTPNSELCRIHIFESGLILFLKEGDPIRIPLGIVDGIKDEGLDLTVRLDDGGTWTFSALARSRDPFRTALVKGMNALQTRIEEALKNSFPGLDPATIPAMSRLFKDGRAVFKDEAEATGPGLWGRLEKAWTGSEAADAYAFLAAKAAVSPIAFGIKHGLWGDLGGDYLFCLAPGLGELIAWETTPLQPKEDPGETEGRATYFFQREAGGDWRSEVTALALRLLMINFRREPICLAQEQLEDAAHAQTARAVRHLEPLRRLRKQFIGRAIHTTPEGWTKSVESILAAGNTGG